MSNDIRFDGRVAVITGAGGGLGRAHALLLASRGARVVVNDLGGAADGSGAGSAPADRVVKEIEEAGGKAVASYDSVATPEGGEAIVQAALDAFGQVDIIINNAGILRDKSFAKLTPEDLGLVLDVHLRGAFHVSQPAFRVMKDRGYGRFIFTTSGAGLFGNFGQTNYSAAKMGLVGLSSTLSLEGAKYNIRSNVIAPIAKTRMTENLLGGMADLLRPELVSPLVAYLCSEECELTHQIVSSAAGRYAHVFVGLTPGWLAPRGAGDPTPEAIRDNMSQVMDPSGYIVPGSINDELRELARKLRS